MLGEEFLKLGHSMFDPYVVFVVNHHRQREFAEGLSLHAERGQRFAQLRNSRFFGIIDQLFAGARLLLLLQVGYEAGLRVVVMTAAMKSNLPPDLRSGALVYPR